MVIVENNGGFEAGFENEQYKSVGAKIIDWAEEIFKKAEIIVKVKEPQMNEVRNDKRKSNYLYLSSSSSS